MKFPSLAAALLAFLAGVHPSIATPYTGPEFGAALKIRIGDKQGAAAYNAAARFVEVALLDGANKPLAPLYIRTTIGKLQPLVHKNEILKSRSTLARALVQGYFKNRPLDSKDPQFIEATKSLIRRLPSSLRTPVALELIFAPIRRYILLNRVVG